MVERHASQQAPQRRRALGSHATPPGLAGALVELGLDRLGRRPRLVVDPSCGAGSFLLATADALVARGTSPGEVATLLVGCDVDPDAVDHCREAMRRWALGHGVEPAPADRIALIDPLRDPTPFGGRADLVVGNPPFLAQRTTDTARDDGARATLRERFGDLGAYVDAAAAFLLVADELLALGGVAVLIQPQSTLAARDGTEVRDRVLRTCELVAMWGDDARHFDAEVDVCAPVLRRRDGAAPPLGRSEVDLHWGARAVRVGSHRSPAPGASWSPLLAGALGVPDVDVLAAGDQVGDRRTIGDVATTTAGFRDEFYALAAAARVEGDPAWSAEDSPLVTVGMIDVCRLDTTTPRRLAGRSVVAPRLDRSSLAEHAPRVARWVDARQRPKVLVATQTRVLEAVADPSGELVPVTPVVSVEPTPDAGLDVWELVAAVCSPTAAVVAARERAGSGMSSGAFRVSAASLRRLPLPTECDAWVAGAAIAARLQAADPGDERSELLREFATTMISAHGGADPALLEWWLRGADRHGRVDRGATRAGGGATPRGPQGA